MLKILFTLILITVATTPIAAGITPHEVVVVYNNDDGCLASKAVADYYCAARGIPTANQLGVTWSSYSGQTWPADRFPSEWGTPREFIEAKYFIPRIQDPLEEFLIEHFGVDPNHPETDPIKAVVLCYGLPLTINSPQAYSSLEGALSLLFNDNPMGREPIGGNVGWNPYYEPDASPYPQNRQKPADFGEFRASAQNDSGGISPPSFSIVRMMDATHAVAGGELGGLYHGARNQQQGTWEWTAVPDLDKAFIRFPVKDICVLDSSHAWAFVDGRAVLGSSDGGQTWQLRDWGDYGWGESPYDYSEARSISMYDVAKGWRVRKLGSTDFIEKTEDNWWHFTSGRGDLPGGFALMSVWAADADHIWVSGDSGIWATSNGGTNWYQQYSASSVGDIWVKLVGNVYKGWAIRGDNKKILEMTDGATWPELSSPTLPGGAADLAVFDETHAAVAYGAGQFAIYSGSSWALDSSDTSHAKCSAAWAGGDIVAADSTSRKSLSVGAGSPGSFVWSVSYTNPSLHWKARYLVCRLDGYGVPLVDLGPLLPGRSGPKMVREMIDRSVASDGQPGGRFILDDGWKAGLALGSDFAECMSQLAGESNVRYETNLSNYVTGETNVMGYVSNGSYDWAGNNATTWFRPLNNYWRPGAIGGTNAVSNDGSVVRSSRPVISDGLPIVGGEGNQSYVVKVTGMYSTSQYATHWIGLHAADGTLLLYTQGQPVRAFFNAGSASVDFSSVNWPGGDHTACMAVHYPNDDPYHSQQGVGEIMYQTVPSLEIWNARSTGITYPLQYCQSHVIDLITEGCSATAGNVVEPWIFGVPQWRIILPQYVSGATWAESCYMGFPKLAWEEMSLGDPLMAPYATPPSVSITFPEANNRLSGLVPLVAEASSNPTGVGIKKVDFWVQNGAGVARRVDTFIQQPYASCFLDTSTIPDGSYMLRAVAYEDNAAGQAAEVCRDVVVAKATSPTTVEITQPTAEETAVSGTITLAATASNPTIVTRVDFRLVGNGVSEIVAFDTEAPFSCAFDTTSYTDGLYYLYAAASWTGGGNSGVAGSSGRRVFVSNNGMICSTIAEARALDDDTQVSIVPRPVSAGTSPSMDGAFYIEEPTRQCGMRVVWTSSAVDTGKLVSLVGTVGTNTATGEKQVVASDVWVEGDSDVEPVGVAGKDVGGTGVTGGVGLNNVGLLVSVFGRVTYVGDDFVYIDDGSGLQDGNNLDGPVVAYRNDGMPWQTTLTASVEAGDDKTLQVESTDGFRAPGVGEVGHLLIGTDWLTYTDKTATTFANCDGVSAHDAGETVFTRVPVCGLRAYYADMPKPGIDDYVQITGVSSITAVGSNQVRYLRVRSEADTAYGSQYIPALIVSGGFKGPDGAILPVDARVRLVGEYVCVNWGDVVHILETGSLVHWGADVMAVTALQADDYITVTGVVTTNGSSGPRVIPDRIYLWQAEGGACGALSLPASGSGVANDGTAGGGPFRPWPYPSADEIVASDWFKTAYNQPGCIGWALAQPDGTEIDLAGEQVISESPDGLIFGLKESFEPIQHAPQLVMVLDRPVPGLSKRMSAVDIVGATLTALSDGRRALIKPKAVYVYTDKSGKYTFWPPLFKDWRRDAKLAPLPDWPWRIQIAP